MSRGGNPKKAMSKTNVNGLRCSILRVRFSKDNFAICECRTKEKIPSDAVLRHEGNSIWQTFVAIGDGLSTHVDQKVILSGTWEPNPKYKNMQLRVNDCVDYVGTSRHEIVSYLSSNILKGIGVKTAEKIYAAFGADAIKVIEEDPQRLMEISGIKEKNLKKIVDSFEANREFHNLTLLLAKYNISYRTIVRIQRSLGKGSVRQIKSNPYCLCRVHGFGFKTADALALEMGFPDDSPFRIEGAVMFALDDAAGGEGHVFLTRQQIIQKCCSESVLHNKGAASKVDPTRVSAVIDLMLKEKRLSSVQLKKGSVFQCVEPIYKNSAYICEVFAARRIAEQLASLEVPEKDWSSIVSNTETLLGVTLDEKQAEAAVMGLSSPLSVITGGPGTGKTTSLNVIVQAYLKLYPRNKIALAAPTGRAARRMSEQTGQPARTLHNLLGLLPGTQTDFSRNAVLSEQVDANLLIIDESSMIDAQLLAELMYRVKKQTQVIFLGDADQLPSVGAGNVLSQLLMSDLIPSVKLEKIFRQAKDSVIPVNAANIRQGITDLKYDKDHFMLLRCQTEEDGAAIITKLVQRSVEHNTISSLQILCPMKRRGDTCTGTLNDILHDTVNPPAPEKKEATVAGIRFRVGDKVMQTRNITGAANGDIGYIVRIYGKETDPENFDIVVVFDSSPEPVHYTYEAALDLVHALAITIHKSQGSEFNSVIVPLFSSMSFFLRRNLLYTAVTRAKKQVILVSDGPGIAAAIRREDTSKRNTLLCNLILDAASDIAYRKKGTAS